MSPPKIQRDFKHNQRANMMTSVFFVVDSEKHVFH